MKHRSTTAALLIFPHVIALLRMGVSKIRHLSAPPTHLHFQLTWLLSMPELPPPIGVPPNHPRERFINHCYSLKPASLSLRSNLLSFNSDRAFSLQGCRFPAQSGNPWARLGGKSGPIWQPCLPAVRPQSGVCCCSDGRAWCSRCSLSCAIITLTVLASAVSCHLFGSRDMVQLINANIKFFIFYFITHDENWWGRVPTIFYAPATNALHPWNEHTALVTH